MSDYPEHDKLTLVKDETQAAGEFLEWLAAQGVQLMSWTETLKDWHPVGERCPERDGRIPRQECTPRRFTEHCLHWQNDKGTCCLCGKGQTQEVTFSGWVADRRSIEQLLADWQGIDRAKIEAEKRAMLAAIRADQER